MQSRIRSMFFTTVAGLLFTTLAILGQAMVSGEPSNTNAVVVLSVILLWPTLSLLVWAGFSPQTNGELGLSRLIKSFGSGLAFVLASVGTLFLAGKSGDPWGISSSEQLSVAGVVFLWILFSGLSYNSIFKPVARKTA